MPLALAESCRESLNKSSRPSETPSESIFRILEI